MSLTRVGLIGGTSWQSTATYYRLLNETVHARLRGSTSAPVTVWSLNFGEIVPLQQAGDWPAQGRVLADAARRLQDGDARVPLLDTTILHCTALADVMTSGATQ